MILATIILKYRLDTECHYKDCQYFLNDTKNLIQDDRILMMKNMYAHWIIPNENVSEKQSHVEVQSSLRVPTVIVSHVLRLNNLIYSCAWHV